MNPFENFDKVYCLNLEERTDRWEICLDNFKKHGVDNYSRFLGKRVESDGSGLVAQKRLGQLGCMLSFCEMIDDAIKNDYNKVVFLEDDFEFIEPKEFKLRFDLSFSELPPDWDMFYFGANVIDELHKFPLSKYSDNLFKLNSAFALHSVSISKKGLTSIKNQLGLELDCSYLNLFNKLSSYEAIDVFFAKDFQIKNKCFISKELLSMQRPDFSSIEGTFYNYSDLMQNRFDHFKLNLIKND